MHTILDVARTQQEKEIVAQMNLLKSSVDKQIANLVKTIKTNNTPKRDD